MDHQPPINLVVDGSLWVHFVDALNLVQTCGHGVEVPGGLKNGVKMVMDGLQRGLGHEI